MLPQPVVFIRIVSEKAFSHFLEFHMSDRERGCCSNADSNSVDLGWVGLSSAFPANPQGMLRLPVLTTFCEQVGPRL